MRCGKKVEGTVCRIIISSPVLASGGIFLCLFLQIGANCVSNGKKLGVANYCNPLIFNCGEYEIRTRDLLHAINRDSPTAHSMLHPLTSSTKSVAQNERHFGHAMTWLPICAIFSASPRCCAMVAHTIVSRAIHSIPLRCWGCGRCHRYGDRRLRYKCPATRLAG